MGKMKDSIDGLTPMEAYQKGYAAGQDTGYEEYERGIREVLRWADIAIDACIPKIEVEAKLKEWDIK